MTKKKKLIKHALEHPEKYSEAELVFFRLWLEQKKKQKAVKKSTVLS